MTRYPSLEEVLVAHSRLIDRFGGSHGLRDRAALLAALGKLETGYYADVIEEAAALMESLSQNHPFIDGNKRTAITTAAAFLRVNGYELTFNDTEAYDFLIGLYATGDFRFENLSSWLRAHSQPINS